MAGSEQPLTAADCHAICRALVTAESMCEDPQRFLVRIRVWADIAKPDPEAAGLYAGLKERFFAYYGRLEGHEAVLFPLVTLLRDPVRRE